MNICRWRISLALAVLAVSLAAPAPAQQAAEKSDDTVVLRAEIKLLKAVYTKQRVQVDALRKQLAELTALVQQLQEQLTTMSQARPTPPAAERRRSPRREPRVTPTPRPVPRPRPRVRPNRRARRGPRTDYASLEALLNTIPPNMLATDSRMGADERTMLSRQVSFHYGGKTLAADIAVTSIKSAGRNETSLTGKSEHPHNGVKVTYNVAGTFKDADREDLKKVSSGQKIALTGKIVDLTITPPTGEVSGPTVRLVLTGCKLIPLAGAGDAPGGATTVQALIRSIPAELGPADADTPEQAQAKITKLDAWAKRELVGKALRGRATILQLRVDTEGTARTQLSPATPQKAAKYSCLMNAQFAGREAYGIARIGRSGQIEFRGSITSAKFATAASRPRVTLELRNCRVTSSGSQPDRPRPGSPRGRRGRVRYPVPPRPRGLD